MTRTGNIYNNERSTDINTAQVNVEDNNTINSKEQIQNEDKVTVNEELHAKEFNKKENNKHIRQIIFLIIFILVVVGTTVVCLVYRYNEIYENTNNIKNDTTVNDDTKYGITDYKDMYYINPLEFKDEQYYKERSSGKYRTEINYVTVSGLKDKQVQSIINKEIKDAAYKYYDYIGAKEDYLVYTDVGANFSNVLSININILMWDNEKEEYRIDETVALNYNLLTGEKITFTDVFASNTPINYIISDMAYTTLAWDTDINFDFDEEEWDKHTNMDNRDTSEYEDIILKNIRDFEKTPKEEVDFYITSSRIHVKMKLGNSDEYLYAGIPSYKYAEYITIYKKFLANDELLKSTYESMPSKQQLVFTDDIGIETYYANHVYDNLYLAINILDYEEFDEGTSNYPDSLLVLKDEIVEKNVVDITNKAKALARENKESGYIVRSIIDTSIDTYKNDFGKEDYICINVDVVVDESSISYYKTSAFKSLAARVMSPKVDVWGAILGNLDDKNIKRLEKEGTSIGYFYDATGKLIAKDWDELEEYMDNKYKEPVEEEPKEIIEDVNIYAE